MIKMLVIQFLAGMALNLIGEPTPEMGNIARISDYVIGAVHVLVAIGLLVNSILLYRALKADAQRGKLAMWGLGSIIMALVAGAVTVSVAPLAEVASFAMAAAFIAAFVVYAKLFFTKAA